jgi:hypothetical protein
MNVGKIIAGIGTLIFIYLIVTNAGQTANIINSLGSTATEGVKTLQGR